LGRGGGLFLEPADDLDIDYVEYGRHDKEIQGGSGHLPQPQIESVRDRHGPVPPAVAGLRGEEREDGHDEVARHAVDELVEGRAEDDAHRELHHVVPEGETPVLLPVLPLQKPPVLRLERIEHLKPPLEPIYI
jgi:hypothetical protein